MENMMLCSCCWTTMRMCTCKTAAGILHCTSQQLVVVSRLLEYYLSTILRSIPEMMMDLPHFSEHRRKENMMLYCYCWTTTQMRMPTTAWEILHCITQREKATSVLLGNYSS